MRIDPLPKLSLTSAFFGAPLVTPVLAIPLVALLPDVYSSAFDVLLFLPFVVVLSLVYGYAGMLLVCLPLMVLLKHFGKLSSLTLCASTTVAGTALWMTLFIGARTPDPASHTARFLLVGALCSLGVSACFSILAEIPMRIRNDRA